MLHPFFVPAQNGAPWLRLDVWEKGNISIVQLEEKLRGAARQALADAIMELRLLPASLCTEDTSPGTWDPENIPGPGQDSVSGEVAKDGGSGRHCKGSLQSTHSQLSFYSPRQQGHMPAEVHTCSWSPTSRERFLLRKLLHTYMVAVSCVRCHSLIGGIRSKVASHSHLSRG